MITVEYHITEKDVAIANYGNAIIHNLRRWRVLSSVVAGVMLILSLFTIIQLGLLVHAIILVGMALYLLTLEPLRRREQNKKFLQSMPENERDLKFVFDETGVEIDNQSLFQGKFDWDVINFVGEYKDQFLIYPKSNLDFCYTVPRRAFRTEADITQLRELLAAKKVDFRLIQ